MTDPQTGLLIVLGCLVVVVLLFLDALRGFGKVFSHGP